jgi:hypothetical protein
MAEDVKVSVEAGLLWLSSTWPKTCRNCASRLCANKNWSAKAAKTLVQQAVTEDGKDLVEQARAENVKVSAKAAPFMVEEEQAVSFMAKDAQDLSEQAVCKEGRSAKAAKDLVQQDLTEDGQDLVERWSRS